MSRRNSFVFYRSFRAAVEGLLPNEYQLFMNAIVMYGLDRTLPDLPPDLSRIFYDYCYPQLEADWVKWERRQSRKGGTR